MGEREGGSKYGREGGRMGGEEKKEKDTEEQWKVNRIEKTDE